MGGGGISQLVILKTVEANIIILTRYVQPSETMTINTYKSHRFSKGYSYKIPFN